MSIDPELRKTMRRWRATMSKIVKSDYTQHDEEFQAQAREFVRSIPARNEEFIRMGIQAGTTLWFEAYFDERRNEFNHLTEWSQRLFDEWLKSDSKIDEAVASIKEDLKKATKNKEEKPGQVAMSFRGGARPGAGRKRIGTTRTIKLTLPDEDWRILEFNGATASEAIRNIIDDWRGNPIRDEAGRKIDG